MRPLYIKKKGDFSFEIKTGYKFNQSGKCGDYLLETYFFFKDDLNIDSSTFNPHKFYEERRMFIRLNTPVFSMSEMLSHNQSPLNRLERILKNKPGETSEIIYNIKLTGCVFKSAIRESVLNLIEEHSEEKLKEEIKLIEKVFAKTRNIMERCSYITNHSIERSVRFVDEYMSVRFEERFLLLLYSTSKDKNKKLSDIVRKAISEEISYRNKKGYITGVTPKKASPKMYERYARQARLVKQFASKILLLKHKEKSGGRLLLNTAYALGAGIAMLLATILGYYAEKQIGSVFWAFVIAAAFIYMLKDRIKDLLKSLITEFMGSLISDRIEKLYLTYKPVKVATVKESTRFLRNEKIPDEIKTSRFREHEQYNESVFLYRKKVHIRDAHIKYSNGLADITTVNMSDFLKLAPDGSHPVVYREGKTLRVKKACEVQYLYLVIRYKSGDIESLYTIRLIVTAKGIRRIEVPKRSDSKPIVF